MRAPDNIQIVLQLEHHRARTDQRPAATLPLLGSPRPRLRHVRSHPAGARPPRLQSGRSGLGPDPALRRARRPEDQPSEGAQNEQHWRHREGAIEGERRAHAGGVIVDTGLRGRLESGPPRAIGNPMSDGRAAFLRWRPRMRAARAPCLAALEDNFPSARLTARSPPCFRCNGADPPRRGGASWD